MSFTLDTSDPAPVLNPETNITIDDIDNTDDTETNTTNSETFTDTVSSDTFSTAVSDSDLGADADNNHTKTVVNTETAEEKFIPDITKNNSGNSTFFKPKSDIDQLQLRTLDEASLQSDGDPYFFELSAADNEELWKNIDLMKEQMSSDQKLHDSQDFEIEFIGGVTMSITAGIVNWILRSGALLTSLLTSTSLFKQFDPLAVVFNNTTTNDKHNETDQINDIENMFGNTNK